MKKLLFLLLIAPHFVSAQCKYSQIKGEDGTKIKVQETELILLYKDMVLGDSKGFTIRQIDSFYYIDMRVSESTATLMAVSETDELIFQLSNNETITLKPLKEGGSKSSGSSAGAHNVLEITYSADKSQIEALSKYGIVKWKFTYVGGAKEEVVKEKWQTRLNEPAKCILTK
jgi:hypothetical protein